MATVYRMQAIREDDDPSTWVTEWLPTRELAKEAHERFRELGWSVRTTKHRVSSRAKDLCEALNIASVSHAIWPGEEVEMG